MIAREFAIEVVRKLQAAGFQALWAGGCVRDQLMGKTPKDFDVATNALPNQVRELFGHHRTIPIGAAFGVITVIGPKSAGQIEVATFRRDSHYSDGRHPDSVEYSNALEDAKRRDFTINGMFYDPLKQQVLDYVGGEHDLQQKIIRAIGDPLERIHEDKLRMLRAVRFASAFGFSLDPVTLRAIRSEADQLKQISAERVGNELVRMLSHSSRARAAELLLDSGLLPQILPKGWYVQADWEPEPFRLCLFELQRLESSAFEAAAVLLLRPCLNRLVASSKDDLSEGFSRLTLYMLQLQERWKLSNQHRDKIAWIARHWHCLSRADELRWCELQPLLIHDTAEQALAVAKAIAGETPGLRMCQDRLNWPSERLNPPWLVGGEALIRLGYRPGPKFKAILQDVRNRQLEGELDSLEQAHQHVSKKFGPP
jgi:poly(A) polymerase